MASAIAIDGVLRGGNRYRVAKIEGTEHYSIYLYDKGRSSFSVLALTAGELKAFASAVDVIQGDVELVRPVNVDMNFNPILASNAVRK